MKVEQNIPPKTPHTHQGTKVGFCASGVVKAQGLLVPSLL